MYCDQNGLIIHRHADTGLPDGGDTAQREGFYWLGVWLRNNIPGLPKWDRQRKLTFDQVLALLEPNKDGRFRRHPIYEPNDADWGFSRDQFVPLVAAMGVYGKYDTIQRLFEALPEDAFGKHTFNGEWRTLIGNWAGENCTDIRKRQCNAADCPLQTDDRDCSQVEDTRDCGTDVDTRDCSNPLTKITCESEKALANKAARANCELQKGTQNGINAGNKSRCEVEKASQNAVYRTQQGVCIGAEAAKKAGCELDKAGAYQICRLGQKFTGDLITPSTSNLIARALNKDPLTNNWIFILLGTGTVWHGGAVGETELYGDAAIRVAQSEDRDNVGDDLNMLVHLAMAKLRYATPVSDGARRFFMGNRRYSYGSYMKAYYKKYGTDFKDMKGRMWSGIDREGFGVDANAVLGAVRWYNRAAEGANPELARLWEPIIEWLKN
ncbi:hypothetical protein FM996_18125 [Methylosinus sporium]|uniref:Uncharacterized protein n=1 Tax=Methylosinus sporium TaxID=428 RepID=A0A549SH82_METSR|nr:hypothetical protein [Methylosinus sporium]TRL28990.1 hypothetical protein FM996_18125 [Methylosinus sporium]